MKTVFFVKDMNCGHCKRHIEEALSENGGVESFDVDLPTKTVRVESSLSAETLAKVIVEAGYTPVPA